MVPLPLRSGKPALRIVGGMSDTLKVVLIVLGVAGFVGLLYLYYRTVAYYYDWDIRLRAEKKRQEELAKAKESKS